MYIAGENRTSELGFNQSLAVAILEQPYAGPDGEDEFLLVKPLDPHPCASSVRAQIPALSDALRLADKELLE